jgi:hypothetical protein
MEQVITEARKLPIEVVALRSVKIGGELYNLDRDIKVPSSGTKDGEADSQSRPAKKVKKEETVSSSAKDGETDANSKPAVKVKTEEEEDKRDYYLEIKWENYGDDSDGNWVTTKYSMFDDEISDENGGIEMSRVFEGAEKKDEGENHQLYLTLCLVDGKSEDRKTLVEIEVYYWTLPINLMHFNILSQDLANFCRDLWKAAGRNADDYCDMAIEFGESRFSKVEILELIEEATGIYKEHVMYIEKTKLMPGATSKDAMTLLELIYEEFPASVICYESDLKSMGIMKDQCDAFGFQQLSYYPWFVGSSSEIE